MSRVLDQFDLPVPNKPARRRRAGRRAEFFQAGFSESTRLRRLTVLVALLIGAAAAFGESGVKPAGSVKFDIPAEPLIAALQAYSLQSGVQVMFETASAVGYQSAPVEGDFAPEVALRALLANTDLRIRYSRPTAITLAPASAPNPDDPPAHALGPADLTLDTLRVNSTPDADLHRFDDYIGAVQADIEKALKKVSQAQRGDYRVAVKLWVDPSRMIQRAELQGTTGDRGRDGAIVNALRGLVLSRAAPANTPQPMLFMLSISAL